jgi:hypothetical protein
VLCCKKRLQLMLSEKLLRHRKLREPVGEGWQVNEWIKRSLCTSLFKNGNMESGILNTTINVIKGGYAEKEFVGSKRCCATELTFQVVF